MAVVALAPATARAQGSGVDAQQFRPGAGAGDVLGVSSAEVAGHLSWVVGAFAHSADDPLTLRDDDGAIRVVIDRQSTVDLALAVGLGAGLQLAAVVPVVVRQSMSDGDESGVGDARIGARLRLLGDHRAAVAGAIDASLPLGDGPALHSHRAVAVHPHAIAELRDGDARVALNLGLRLRETHVEAGMTSGSELTWGVGVRFPVTGSVGLAATLAGAVGLIEGHSAPPVELLAAAEIDAGSGWTVLAGGGPGLSAGSGAADLRLLAALRYRAHTEPGVIATAPAVELAPPTVHAPVPARARPWTPPEPRLPPAMPERDHAVVGTTDDTAAMLASLERIQFDVGRASVREDSLPVLDQLAHILLANPQITKIRVDGHTDDQGSPARNRALSLRRAQRVVVHLLGKGVSARRLAARGFGDTHPLVDNDRPEHRELNRRVELTVLEIGGEPIPFDKP